MSEREDELTDAFAMYILLMCRLEIIEANDWKSRNMWAWHCMGTVQKELDDEK